MRKNNIIKMLKLIKNLIINKKIIMQSLIKETGTYLSSNFNMTY